MYYMPSDEDYARLRPGQRAVLRYAAENPDNLIVPIRLPGGYGKTVTAAAVYKYLRSLGKVDRVLFISANNTQRGQIVRDFESDCAFVQCELQGKEGKRIWLVQNDAATLAHSKLRLQEVFSANVQTIFHGVKEEADVRVIIDLLRQSGKWMIVCDEYHHLGQAMEWGKAVEAIKPFAEFVLAMSATPYRNDVDTVFGNPPEDLIWTYDKACRQEKVLKAVAMRAFDFDVNSLTAANKSVDYITEDMESIFDEEEIRIERRKLRKMYEYIVPQLDRAIWDLVGRQTHTKRRLQMIVRVDRCAQAEALCEVISRIVAGLSVDWVATTRAAEDNKKVCERFCPPKLADDPSQRGEPDLDILVQVGIATEGFDCPNVVSLVDLSNTANEDGNQTKQFILRASRLIYDLPWEEQYFTIYVPTDHFLSRKNGEDDPQDIIAWLDDHPKANGNQGTPRDSPDWDTLPPLIQSPFGPRKVALRTVYATDERVKSVAVTAEHQPGTHRINPDDPADLEVIARAMNIVMSRNAERFNAREEEGNKRREINTWMNRMAKKWCANNQKPTTGDEYQELISKAYMRLRGILKDGAQATLVGEQLIKRWDYVSNCYQGYQAGIVPAFLR